MFLVSLSRTALFFPRLFAWHAQVAQYDTDRSIRFSPLEELEGFSVTFRRAVAIALVISLAAALYYPVPSIAEGGRAGGPPHFAFASATLKNLISQVALLLGTSPEVLVRS